MPSQAMIARANGLRLVADEEFLRHLMPSQAERQKFLKDNDPNKRAKLIERVRRRVENAKWDEDAFPPAAQQLDVH